MIIAIDGPSGSGKTTLGRMLAHALKLLSLDPGSMYRAVALAVIEAGMDPNDKASVTALANRIDIDLEGNPDCLCVLLDGRDIGTVVFPDADIKFFLTAAPEERAERRYKEDHITALSSVSYAETLADMIERDHRDSTRV